MRYSGKYIRFNNEIYRIVNQENNLTKITLVDVAEELQNKKFSDSTTTLFSESTLKTELETYINNMTASTQDMIAKDQIWYLEAYNRNHYKETICKTADSNTNIEDCEKVEDIVIASIGLPRFGEIFTSQISRREKLSFWSLTPFLQSYIRAISKDGIGNGYDLSREDINLAARISLYLKENIVIAKNNTGDRTYESPYNIELNNNL